ncbi:N-formylglutamate amidohydrolase [Paracoccus pacificus]
MSDKMLPSPVEIEGADAPGDALIICEHAANDFPAQYGDLGLSEDEKAAHIAWDPGALGLARGLARNLNAPLVLGTISRLIYDLNRPPHAPGAMAETSEIYRIPDNADLPVAERLRRTAGIYLPFHNAVAMMVAARLALGQRPVVITVHSFTPVWHGTPRQVEFGVIHDADDRLARAITAQDTGLMTMLNEPYSAADGVAHMLATHATPLGLANVMLELRNDLLADPAAQAAMADRLTPVLRAAITAVR